MTKIFHPFYVLLGHIVCRILRAYWVLRDKINPPREETLLIVTHPDDDTLFFHTAIKEYKPYVALMVTGWSLKRLRDFIKVMRNYGVKFRAYDTYEHSRNVESKVLKQVRATFKSGNFKRCLTHNAEGEYGHEIHKLIHKCVINEVKCEIFVPVSKETIKNYPLEETTVKEKEDIFRNYYITETFVIDEYSDWLRNEKLVRFDNE